MWTGCRSSAVRPVSVLRVGRCGLARLKATTRAVRPIGHVPVDITIEQEDKASIGGAETHGMLNDGMQDLLEIEGGAADCTQSLGKRIALAALVVHC